MKLKILKNKKFLLKLILIFCILIFHFNRIEDTSPTKGAYGDNFVYSYNLAKYKVYSKSKLDSPEILPDSHFLPLIPLINYSIIKLDKNLINKDIKCFLDENSKCEKTILKYMKLYNFFSFVLLIYFFYNFSKFFFTKNISFIVTIVFLLGSWYYNILNSFKYELLASSLFLGWSFYRIKFLNKKKNKYIIYAGISVGLLMLTRSIFIMLILVKIFFYLKYFNKHNYIKNLILIFIIFSFLTPWAFYQKSISKNKEFSNLDLRSGKIGQVMSIRAEKNQMNIKEYFGGYLYFSPSGGKRILDNFLNYDYYERWDRSNPFSFHKTMMHEDNFIKKRLKKKNLELNDKNLINESILSFLEQPIKHVFTSMLFMYRGFWPDAIDRPSLFYAFFSFIFFLYFYFSKLFNNQYRKKNIDLLIILFPCIFVIFFHSIFTHYQPRYSIPIMAPILIFFSGNILNYIVFKFSK